MTVADLIELLKKHPQNLEVIIDQFSDFTLLDSRAIMVTNHCVARPDGNVQYYRKDLPTQQYLYLGYWV